MNYSLEMVMAATLLVIGAGAGMERIANVVNTKYDSMATAISTLDNSYSFKGLQSKKAKVAGSSYRDSQQAIQTQTEQ